MEITILFESFMVYYLMQVLVLVIAAYWYNKEKPITVTTEVNTQKPTGTSASELIKMRSMVKELERQK
jgi:hypothetical protein